MTAVILLAACSGENFPDGANSKLNVAATTVQIAALAREVAGQRGEVVSMIPPGADAHEFEPTASDLKAIDDADLVLRQGLGLDKFLDQAIGGAAGAPVVEVTQGIELQPPALEGEEGDAGAFDPHVWHDPTNDKIMVDNIRDALISVDPEGQSTYRTNAETYKQVLDETDAEIQQIINGIPPENRKLVTNHDAFGYFARRYGLEIIGAVIPSATTEAEPSAEDTANLLETIEREGVKAIFAESSVNADLARQLADDAGVKVVDNLYGDSLGEPGTEAGTVHGMLLVNARLIADALR